MKNVKQTVVVASLMFEPYNKMFEQARRVYGLNGLAPAVCAHSGGHLEPKVIEVYEDQQKPQSPLRLPRKGE